MNERNTVSSQRYLPFGEVRDLTEITTTPSITQTDLGYTGQRSYTGFGLMDYNARFYSPGLGRFTQPDTIIPGATITQSWNRYSYVRNNPINANDPSGHNLVRLDNGDYFARSTASVLARNIAAFEEEYGVTFDDEWTLSDKVAMRNDIKKLARKMADAIGLSGKHASRLFKRVFKHVAISFPHPDGFSGCQAYAGPEIKCGTTNPKYEQKNGHMADFINDGLIVHELGHVFDHRIALHDGGDYVFGYAQLQLSKIGNGVVASDGREVVGTFSDAVGFVDNSLGYQEGNPYKENRPYQQHRNGGTGEQWADMFMNWALGSFADDTYGRARDSYMDGVMRDYILSAIGGPARSIIVP